MENKLLPIIYLIGVFLLILPGFLNKNSNLKTFITNVGIWFFIILILITIMYLGKFIIL